MVSNNTEKTIEITKIM